MNKPREEKKCGTTHIVCNTRLEKEGGKARCCRCVPHKDCDFLREEEKICFCKNVLPRGDHYKDCPENKSMREEEKEIRRPVLKTVTEILPDGAIYQTTEQDGERTYSEAEMEREAREFAEPYVQEALQAQRAELLEKIEKKRSYGKCYCECGEGCGCKIDDYNKAIDDCLSEVKKILADAK